MCCAGRRSPSSQSSGQATRDLSAQKSGDAAKLILPAAGRNDGGREFCAGYTAAVDTQLSAFSSERAVVSAPAIS
jgi:hypothetical protein